MHDEATSDTPADLGRPVGRGTLARTGATPPRYAFRPGVTPHPDRVAGVHAPSIDAIARAFVSATDDGDDDARSAAGLAAIRLGADLHDAGWWWEAHEAWEIPWRAWSAADPGARLLRALIQDAAAWLQLERGRPAGVRRLVDRARLNREAAIAAGPSWAHWLGLDHRARHRVVVAHVDRSLRDQGHDPRGVPTLPLRFPQHDVSSATG